MIYIFHLKRRKGVSDHVPSYYTYITGARSESQAKDELGRNEWLEKFTIEHIATARLWDIVLFAILPVEMHLRTTGWLKPKWYKRIPLQKQ